MLNKIRNVREVLEVDLETWRLFVERELAANAPDVKEVSHPGHGSPSGTRPLWRSRQQRVLPFR